MGLEIERKFTVKRLPENLEGYPVHIIEQGYLNVAPAIRVRREDEKYYMTYKSFRDFSVVCEEDGHEGSGDDGKTSDNSDSSSNIGKIEYNLPLDKDSYEHLVEKADGNVIRKKRYLIPLNTDAFNEAFLNEHSKLKSAVDDGEVKIELDVFEAPFEGRVLAEVEFPDEESAAVYKPAEWFDQDVTGDVGWSNAHMSREEL